jgi:hypothetical protein
MTTTEQVLKIQQDRIAYWRAKAAEDTQKRETFVSSLHRRASDGHGPRLERPGRVHRLFA